MKKIAEIQLELRSNEQLSAQAQCLVVGGKNNDDKRRQRPGGGTTTTSPSRRNMY